MPMTKRQFEEMFREEVLPYLVEREREGFPDKPARREAWNNTIDAYIRDRSLPEAAGNWAHPRWLETWRPSQRHHATKARQNRKSPAQLDREIAEALTGNKAPARRPTAPAHARVRKTKDIWVVQGNYGYGHGWEDVTAAETWKEAKQNIREYRENESGVPFRVIRRRERIEAASV
jgi:hypothetical protein